MFYVIHNAWRNLTFKTDFPFVLFITFAFVCGVWSMYSSVPISPYVLFAVIIVVGFPHGIFDAFVYFSNKKRTVGHLGLFYLVYIGIVAFAFVVFVYLPMVFMAVFLFLSAWHFGSDYYQVNHVFSWLQIGIGTLLITSPLLFYPDVCVLYFRTIFNVDLTPFLPLIWLISTAAFVIACWYRKHIAFPELCLLVVAAYLFEPLLYFCLYFICLHSIRYYCWAFNQYDFSLKKEQKLIIFTLILLVIALVIMSIYLFTRFDLVGEHFSWIWVFCVLGSLSLPHVLVVHCCRKC